MFASSAACLLVACAGTVMMAQAASAQTYSFTVLSTPETFINGLNDKGDMIVNMGENGSFYRTKCILVQGSKRTRIAFPHGPNRTECSGLSDDDTVVGYTYKKNTNTGFIYQGGVYTETKSPVRGAQPLGISADSKNISGTFYPAEPIGYILKGERSRIYQVPNAVLTYVESINDAGDAVVYSVDQTGTQHNYVRKNGKLTEYRVPGAVFETFLGINNADMVVGYYSLADGLAHGFVYDIVGGVVTTVDIPNCTDTIWVGINNNGILAGACENESDQSIITYGAYATPN